MKKQQKPVSATGLQMESPVRRGRRSLSPSAAAMGGILSCLGTLGLAGGYVTAFDLPISPWALAAALVFPLLWTAVYNSSQWCVPLTLVMMALCGLALGQLVGDFVQGFLHTANHMFQVFARQSIWAFPQYLTEPASLAEVKRVVTLFGLLVLFPWSGLVAWAAGRRASFMLTFCLTAPFLAVGLFFRLQPAIWAVLCLFLCWSALAFSRLSPQRSPAVGFAALPALALCLLLLLLAAPEKDYVRPKGMETLRARAEELARTVPGQISEALGGSFNASGRGFLTHDQRRRSFWGVGSVSFTGKTDLRVKTDGDGPLYLKGFTGATYRPGGWSSLPEAVLEELAAASAPIQPQNLTAALFPILIQRGLTVENLANPKMVYAPPWLMSTPEELPDIQFLGDAGLRSRSFLGLPGYTLRYGDLIFYNDTIRPGQPWRDPEAVKHQMEAYEAAAMEHYTQVPGALAPVLDNILGELAEDRALAVYSYSHFNGDRPLVDTASDSVSSLWLVRKIQQYLQSEGGFAYTLTPGAVPPGRDLTEYFLTESRQGYCVYFATAGTLLLRRAGVPARYCEGYLVTGNDLNKQDAEGFSDIPDRRSHAWVEYYIPGMGWMTLDCTPGFNGGNSAQPNNATNEVPPTPRPSATPRPTAEPTPPPSATPATPAPTTTPTTAPEGPGRAEPPPWLTAALKTLGWTAAVILGAVLRRRGVLALRRRAFAGGGGNKAALARYVLLERLAPWAGEVEEDLTRLAEKARFSSHRLTPAELDLLDAGVASAQRRALEKGNPLQRIWLRYGVCLC